MRDIPTLLELEEIPVLWQYLYMDEENFITVDNLSLIHISEPTRQY